MRIALAQLNPTVGDVAHNAAALADAYTAAVAAGAQLVVSGELGLTGYPPDDLLLKPAFIRAVRDHLDALASDIGTAPLLAGFPEDVREDGGPVGVIGEDAIPQGLANSAALLVDGQVGPVYRKQRIPNYGVFDEARYFRAGTELTVADVVGIPVGVTVCEDLWGDGGPVTESARQGARIVLSPNASPFHHGKRAEREHWARRHARDGGAWIVYVNLAGGQDDVVYDGDSFVMAPDGTVVARAEQFAEDLVVVDIDPAATSGEATSRTPRLTRAAAVYEAVVIGTRDYLRKNGFDRALIGVSGGIDSALAVAVAVDALGPEQVTAVAMPSPYSSPGSMTDARDLVDALGCTWLQLPIDEVMEAFDAVLAEPFAGTEAGIAEENIQSRIRGTLLMALSNKHGDLVLATGNKSEYAVGYATLYGDMAGGFAPLKDVYKTLVYELCRYRNAEFRPTWCGPAGPVIPTAIIDKPPSAELRPDQRDTDSLPEYDQLDAVLTGYIEQYHSVDRLVADGHDRQLVTTVTRMVDRAEYKRRQAPPGVKVTSRAFGRERRLPITNRWSG
ncbi:MAG: NAD+ synthase [Actinobacteria bacterium]|nr:NAD+ synthase [Actinomycetota bacterium]